MHDAVNFLELLDPPRGLAWGDAVNERLGVVVKGGVGPKGIV